MNVEWNYCGLASGKPFVPKLPQSAWCFDPSKVLNRVGNAFSDQFEAFECRIINVQHKPRRSLDLVYEFTDFTQKRHVANFRFVPPDRFSDVSMAAFADGTNCKMVRRYESWSAIAWLLPKDPEMPFLGDMIPTGSEAPACFAQLPPDEAAPFKTPPVNWSMLSYRTGDRATIRVHSENGSVDIVAKMHASACCAHRKLSDLSRQSPVRDRMPRPIAMDAGRQIRLERFVVGSSFDDTVAKSGLDCAATKVIAGLVELHGSKVGGMVIDDAADTHRRLVDVVLKRIDRARLPIGPTCHRLASELGRRCPQPNRSPTTVHGDLHTGNVVFTGNRATFIDLDGVRCGDPVFDLALFGSRLLLIALTQATTGFQPVAKVVEGLPETYERQGGSPIERSRFVWFLAALIVTRQVKTCITNAAPDIVNITNALGTVAESLLDSGRLDTAVLPAGKAAF